MDTPRECIFCQIRDKKILAQVVYEDGQTIAILDVQPRAPGHTIVVPKYHAPTILDLPETEVGSVFGAVRTVAGLLIRNLKAEGLTIGINHGWISGQVVDHLHIHLLPRFPGDRGGSIQSIVNNPPQEALQEIAKKITTNTNV